MKGGTMTYTLISDWLGSGVLNCFQSNLRTTCTQLSLFKMPPSPPTGGGSNVALYAFKFSLIFEIKLMNRDRLEQRKAGKIYMSHQLKKLLPRHKKIMDLCFQGKTFVEIAKEVMMSPRAISYIYKSPIFMKEFRLQMRKRTFEKLF
jgi:hypothetical protein